MLTDFSRHAKVHVHTICGSWGGSHCKAGNPGVSLKPSSRSASLPRELHFLKRSGDPPVFTSTIAAAWHHRRCGSELDLFLRSLGIYRTILQAFLQIILQTYQMAPPLLGTPKPPLPFAFLTGWPFHLYFIQSHSHPSHFPPQGFSPAGPFSNAPTPKLS